MRRRRSDRADRSAARAAVIALAALVTLGAAGGCIGGARETTTARTAEEQLLVSTAAERAVGTVDASRLAGRSVHVDVELLAAIDRGYVISAFREVCALAGARLVDTRAEADVAVEVRSAGLGNIDAHYTLRFPTLYVLGRVGVPDSPDFIEIGYVRHRGWAHIQCFAYERRTGAHVFGFRDGWGRSNKSFFEDIYPPASIVEGLKERGE